MQARYGWAALASIAAAYILLRLAGFFLQPQMHDFHVYYYAAEVAEANLDPYQPENLRAASRGLVQLPFVYPPYVPFIFSPFTALEPTRAARVYLVLKLLALSALVGLWMLIMPPERRAVGLALLLLFVAVGFHESAIRDLKFGNVSTFEQLALWAGFFSLLRARYFAFSLLVVAASLFKLVPILFLALLLLVPERRGWWPMAAGMLAFLTLQGLTYAAAPTEYQDFLRQASLIDERGSINPSTLAFFLDLVGGRLAHVCYLLTAVGLTCLFAFRFWTRRGDRQLLEFLVGAVLLFALAAPRMKDYSYMLLIFPAAWLILGMASYRRPLAWGAATLVVVGFFAYQNLLIALLLFGWWLWAAARGSAQAVPRTATSPS